MVKVLTTEELREKGFLEMDCVCGEHLVGSEKGDLWKQYQQHMLREDHQASTGAWALAYFLIDAKKEEKAKSSFSGESKGNDIPF